MGKILKWGIAGPGNIARRFASDMALLSGHQIVAVGSRNLERARTFAAAFGVPAAYGSYDQLFADPAVDIVYVSSPHHAHVAMSIAAMQAGKHVLCEKPVAVNRQQAEEMFNVAQDHGVFLMEGMWSRFNPSIMACLQLAKDGILGEVSYINADFFFYREAPAESRMFNMELAGGALLDIGIYPVFLAYLILGMPKKIQATAHFHPTGADLHTSALLKYERGVAHMACGFHAHSEMRARICGTEGEAVIWENWHRAQGYSVFKNEKRQDFPMPTPGRGFTFEIEECRKCIEEGALQSALWSHQNSLDLMGLLDSIRTQIGLRYPFE